MLTFIIILTFVASFFGTIAGFGSSVIMLPVLLFFFPLPEVLLFAGIVHILNDIWEMVLFRGSVSWRILIIFGATGVIATLIGAGLALSVPQDILSRVLGVIIIAYVVIMVFKPKFSLSQTNSTLAIGGTTSGFLAGIFGIGGPVRSMFLTSFKLPKKVYIFTMGAVSIIVDVTRIGAYIVGGTKLPESMMASMIFLIPISLFGAEAAKLVVDKLPQKLFRTVVAVFLLIVGIIFLVFTDPLR